MTTCEYVAEHAGRASSGHHLPDGRRDGLAPGAGVGCPNRFPCHVNRCVARVVPRQIAVQQTTYVPVVVPTCLTCD